jgi:hypothetical protein
MDDRHTLLDFVTALDFAVQGLHSFGESRKCVSFVRRYDPNDDVRRVGAVRMGRAPYAQVASIRGRDAKTGRDASTRAPARSQEFFHSPRARLAKMGESLLGDPFTDKLVHRPIGRAYRPSAIHEEQRIGDEIGDRSEGVRQVHAEAGLLSRTYSRPFTEGVGFK